jgi:hypothetical protein
MAMTQWGLTPSRRGDEGPGLRVPPGTASGQARFSRWQPGASMLSPAGWAGALGAGVGSPPSPGTAVGVTAGGSDGVGRRRAPAPQRSAGGGEGAPGATAARGGPTTGPSS